jgi:hypothetical protein
MDIHVNKDSEIALHEQVAAQLVFLIRNIERDTFPSARDLDDLVHVAVNEARRRGYSLQQLYDRLREHLLAAPPDHLLVLSDDAGMRMLLPKELKERFECPVDVCTPGDFAGEPGASGLSSSARRVTSAASSQCCRRSAGRSRLRMRPPTSISRRFGVSKRHRWSPWSQ